jgi:hypothetical protein
MTSTDITGLIAFLIIAPAAWFALRGIALGSERVFGWLLNR